MADVVNNGAVNKTKWGIEADKLNVKFNSIDSDLTTINGRLDGVDSDLTTVNGRLDGVDSDLTTLTRSQAIQLLKQQDSSLVFKGFAKPGDAVPAASLNHAYIVTNTGTVFDVDATEGQVLVGDGTGFEKRSIKEKGDKIEVQELSIEFQALLARVENIEREIGLPKPDEPELLNFVDGLSTPLTTAHKDNVNNFIRALKAGLGISALSEAFDAMYVLAGETPESSLRNLVKRSYDAELVQSPTWTKFEGFKNPNYAGNYIKTNFIPNIHKEALTLNSTSIGFYSRTDKEETSSEFGCRVANGDDMLYIIPRIATNTASARVNQDVNTDVINATNEDSRGMFIATRNSSTKLELYKNKELLGTANNASASIPNIELYIGAINQNGSAALLSTRQISFAFIGKGLSAEDITVLVDAFELYMDSHSEDISPLLVAETNYNLEPSSLNS